MTLLAIPNVSEGNDRARIDGYGRAMEEAGARVLDVHSDGTHNRSVFTVTAEPEKLIQACVALADATSDIDLTQQRGVHPRLGALDVCPFVPHGESSMDEAKEAAERSARLMATQLAVPVYLYGESARRPETRALPDLRRGGLEALTKRALDDLPPDEGPDRIDPRRGVVCVGARGPLIAFNVWLNAEVAIAKQIASGVRSSSVRALGLELPDGRSQVSLNLIDPATTGIEQIFGSVEALAMELSAEVRRTEIVGLVEARFLPSPDAKVARLSMQPDHSLEAVLQGAD